MAEGEILRFPALQKSVNQFIEEQKNKQTLSKARRDVGLLCEFLKSKQESRKIEEIQSQELNDFLSEFIVTATVYSDYSDRNASSEFSTHPMRTARLACCTISATIFCQSFFNDSTFRCFRGHLMM